MALFTILILQIIIILLLIFLLIWKDMTYQKIMKKARLIAQGQLNVEDILVNSSQSSSAIIADAFDSIKNNLLTFIEATKVNVITLSDAIKVLSESADGNQQGNEVISRNVSMVAQKSSEQLDLVEKNKQLIQSSSVQIQEIETSMHQITDKLDENVRISEKGIGEINGYSTDIDTLSSELQRIHEIMDTLNEEINQIEEIGDFIITINKKLMLLAFNASIEAARVGQAGQGFSVVANEMNKMSIDTGKGMEKITGIVKDIVSSSQQVNDSIKNCENTFYQSKDAFENVAVSFKSINDRIYDIHQNVQSISNKTGIIASNSNQLLNQAEELFQASQKISEQIQEIADTSERNANGAAQISLNVSDLSSMLDNTQGLLKQFNTSVVPTSKTSNKKIRIAFLSMLDNDFWFGVRKGVFYAMKELADQNVFIDYIPLNVDTDLSLDDQVANIMNRVLDEGYDGIILPGFIHSAEVYLKEAISRGIKVVAFNCDIDSSVKRLAVFSPDGYEAGEIAAKHMIKAINRSGAIGIVTGDQTVQVNVDRKEGFLAKLKNYKKIQVLFEDNIKDDPDLVYQKCLERLRKHPNLKALYVTTGLQLSVAQAIEDLHLTGKVIIVCFDDNQEIFEFIKKGIIYATITQDPFGQGHDPIVWLYNNIVANEKFPKENMGCRLSVIDGNNVSNLINN